MSKVMLRHDTPLEVIIRAGDRVISRDVIEASVLNAHLTIKSYCLGGHYDGLNYGASTRAWHDGKGNLLNAPPKTEVNILDESYILKEGELCECLNCLEEAA